MEGHPLETRIRALIRRSRTWTVWHAACIGSAMIGVALLSAAWLDFMLRFQDRGVRAMFSCAICACLAGCVHASVRRYRRLSFDQVTVARELERRFPPLRGVLASAVEFLASDARGAAEGEAGSRALRRSVVEKATRAAESLDFLAVLDGRAVFRASLTAGCVFAAAAASFGANPSAASLAIARLAQPWRELAWPRRHVLILEASSAKVARGQAASFVVRDAQGRLPDDLRLEVAVVDATTGGAAVDVSPSRESTPELSSDRLEARSRLENVTQSVRIRAVGGDDRHADWLTLEVVEPPTVEWRVAQWTAPEYLSQPARPLVQPIRAVVGSRIDLRGVLSRPVKSAVIKELTPATERTGDGHAPPRNVPLAVGAGGMSISTDETLAHAWQLVESGVFVVEVEDDQGVSAELSRWVIDVANDSPPSVWVSTPVMQAYATPAARLTVRGSARDDFGVERAELQWRVGRAVGAEAGSAKDRESWGERPAIALELAPQSSDAAANANEPRGFLGVWRFASDLAPDSGDVVEYRVVAWDRKPQAGESEWRRVEIVAEEEFERRLAQREALLLETLRETLRTQRRAAEQTRTAAEEHSAGDASPAALGEGQVERLQAIELVQRSSRKLLTDEQTGLIQAIDAVQSTLTDNGLESSVVARRWRGIRETLTPIVEEELPIIERVLTHAVRTRREMPDESVRASLVEAASRQTRVVETLEQLIERLAPWDRLQRQSLDLAEVRAAVDARRGETERLLVEQGRAGSEEAEQMQTRRRLSDELLDLGRRVERLLGDLRATRGVLPTDSEATRAVDRALAEADASAPSGQLRDAGKSVRDNRLGAALERQEQTTATLDRILDALANRVADSASTESQADRQRRQRDLEAWTADVERLIEGQDELLAEKQTPSFEDKPPLDAARRWSSRQSQLAQAGDDALARLPGVPAFQFVLRSAVARMRSASRRMEKLAGDHAFADAGEGRRRLETLRAALAAARNSATDAAAPARQSPAAKSGEPNADPSGRPLSWTELQLLRDLQVDLADRTEALERGRQPDGTLDAEGRRALRELATEQAELLRLAREMLP